MKKIGGMLIFLSFFLFSCSYGLVPNSKINLKHMHQLEEKYGNDLIVIDVRTYDEYIQGRIPGAINIDKHMGKDAFLNKVNNKFNKEEPIVVYCRSGNRSAEVFQWLINDGFTEVYDFGSYGNYS